MRQQLKAINDQRLRFLGLFERFGWKNGYRGPERTILLKDIRREETPTSLSPIICGLPAGKLSTNSICIPAMSWRLTPG